MERETKKFKTPAGGQEVEIKTYLTGREKREIQSVFINDANFKEGKFELGGQKLSEAQDKTIEILIVSVDGSKENVLNKVLDMRTENFDFVIDEMNKISNPTPEEIKK